MDQPTINTYNQMAQEYDDETSGFWDKFPASIIDTFIESGVKRVVDIGSGPGRDGLILQRRGLDVTCLDASEAMVAICHKRGLKASVGDFNTLPYSNGELDGVWAYTSLLHVPKAEIDRPMSEIQRVLKPDGVLGLGMIEGETEGYRESSGVTKPRWFSYYSEAELRALLEKHGFKVTYFEVFVPGKHRYLNFVARKKQNAA